MSTSTSSVLLESLPKTGESVKFAKTDGFMQALRERVDAYFTDNDISKRDHPSLYLKTFIIMSWLAATYIWLVFGVSTVAQALLGALSLGLATAAVGFNIQHDGGHGAYSRYPFVNRLMAFALDMLGGSSFIWKRTHNIVHHSYTNVTGVDADIDLGGLGRLSPHQPHYAFHRLQHFYLWFLYGFITFKWQFHDDMKALFIGRVGPTRIPRPRGLDLFTVIAGKILFFTLAFGIPLYFHAWYHVLGVFVAASFVQGLTLAVVFQLAHVVEHADFPMPSDETARIENEWAVHQVETTVDFAQRNPFVCWFVGGLNFQIEHHLFPQICHIHYPAIAKIVRETAEEFDVSYYSHKTVWSALASHYRWIRQMGRKPAVQPA